jgi:type IV secretory pathway VirB3-like protein
MSEHSRDEAPDIAPLFKGLVRPALRAGVHVGFLYVCMAMAGIATLLTVMYFGSGWLLLGAVNTVVVTITYLAGALLTQWDPNYVQVLWRQAMQKDYYPAGMRVGVRRPKGSKAKRFR